MHTGTISDIDPDGEYGLIDTDDGRLVLFNLKDIAPPLRKPFNVGTRVEFVEKTGPLAPRALALSPLAPPEHSPPN